MMKAFTTPLIVLCLISVTADLIAQKKSAITVNGNFAGLRFRELVPLLESQTNLKFFFDPSEIDTLKIDVSANEKVLTTFLQEIFTATDFHFFTGPNNTLYITKGLAIQPALPADFFDSNGNNQSNL